MRGISFAVTALTFAALAVSGKSAHAQANVTESNSNYIYVDAMNGKDSNAGTQSAPVRTVQAGFYKADTQFNHKGQGSRVEILPGTYRETVAVWPTYKHTSAPITLEAVTPGTVTIAGSDVYTGWADEGAGAIFDHGWSYKFGACPLPNAWPSGLQPIVFRREMVIVNGTPLTQVLDAGLLTPGTFFVDQTNSRLRVAPPSGVDLNAATVEVATRPTTLTVSGRTNFVVRGIGMEHAANCIGSEGGEVSKSSNVLVDKIWASTNNWGGFGVWSVNDVTIQNSVASYNGGFGMNLARSTNLLLSNTEMDYNNWRGAQGAFYDWGMGAIKFWQIHGATVKDIYAYNNHAQGLWFDTDNRDITVDNANLAGNLLGNLQVELNAGPISMTNSVLCYGGLGANLNSSSNFSLTNSKLFDNGGPGVVGSIQGEVYIAGPNSGRHFSDWQTGQYHNVTTSDITLTGNIIEDWSYSNENVIGTYVSGSAWTNFVKTLVSDENTWYDPNRPTAFSVTGGHRQALNQWQSATGADKNSVWSEPVYSALQQRSCKPAGPAQSDFGVFTDRRIYQASKGSVNINLMQKSFGSTFANAQATITATGLPADASMLLAAPTVLPVKASANSMRMLTIAPGAHATKGVAIPVTLVATANGRVHTVTLSIIP